MAAHLSGRRVRGTRRGDADRPARRPTRHRRRVSAVRRAKPRSSSASGPTAGIGGGDMRRRCWPSWRTEIAARGYRRVYLTTGDRQPEAEELYLSTGLPPARRAAARRGRGLSARVPEDAGAMSEHSAPGGRARRIRLASRGMAALARRRARHQRPILVRSRRHRRTRAAGLRDLRRRAHPSAAPPCRDRAPVAGRQARCRAGRLEGRAGDPPHRAHSGRHRHPHRAVPHLQSHCHA